MTDHAEGLRVSSGKKKNSKIFHRLAKILVRVLLIFPKIAKLGPQKWSFRYKRLTAGVGSDKWKSDKLSHFVAFLSHFWWATNSDSKKFKKRQLVAFLSLICRFFVFFWNFLWFLDLKFFLFGRNSLTFVPLRLFLRDVTILTGFF